MPDRTDYRPIEASYAQVALFASLMAPVIAVVGFCGRLGFADNSPWTWARFVGLSWFLIQFSYAARKLLRTSGDPLTAPWWQGHAPLTLAGLALVVACGVEQTAVTRVAVVLFAILGGTALVWRSIEYARLRSFRTLWLLLFALLMGLYAAGSIWGGGFENPLFVANLCNGYAHIDTLFHASLANMLRTYGACSTGLDGLPHVLYHFGSHWVFARFSNLLDLPVIDFYNLAYPVIFAPFVTFSLLTFAVSIAEIWRGPGRPPENSRSESDRPTKAAKTTASQSFSDARDSGFHGPGLLFWFVVAAGVIGVLPLGSGIEPVARAAPIFASESYGLAIAVALLGIAAVSALSRDIATAPQMRSIDVLLGFLFFCTLPAVVGLLKISVMMLLSAAAAWFFIRLRLYRCKVTAPSFVIGLGVLYCGFLFTYNPEYGQLAGIAPFSALKALVGFTWWSYYWLFCYAWTLVFVALRLREEGVRTIGDIWSAFRERRLLDVELVLIVAVLGSVPEILLSDYSSTHYFAIDQQWLALGLTLAVVLRPVRSGALAPAAGAADAVPGRPSRTQQPQSRTQHLRPNATWLSGVRTPHLLAVLLGLFAVGTFVLNTDALLSGVAAVVKGSLGLAPASTGPLDAAWSGDFKQARQILDRQVVVVEERFATDKNVIALLRGLDRLPLEEKRRSLLYIPKTNRQFWDLLHTAYSPKDSPLVAPALSGIAMLDGLYDRPEGDVWSGYGYQHYPCPIEKQKQPPLDEYLPLLKQRCAKLGMTQLLVIDEREGRSEVRKFECP
jgi:hypothetical protein